MHNAVMGLGGFVRCRCLEDRKVQLPAELAGHIVVDEDGYLDVPGDREKAMVLERWQHSACPHEDMEFFSAHVGNWSAYRGFQHALRQLGWQHYPVLHAVLPEANGGTAPALAGPAALAELDFFVRHADLGEEALLCDADTGEVVWVQNFAFGGANVIMPGLHMGVDPAGFFVRRTGEDGVVELFRA